MLLPGSGRHTWDAGCASRRQLLPARANCGSPCFLQASVKGMSVTRQLLDNQLYETDDTRRNKPARKYARARVLEAWKCANCVALCVSARPARRAVGPRSEVKFKRPGRRTTSARSGSDFLPERLDTRRILSRLRLRLRVGHTAARPARDRKP